MSLTVDSHPLFDLAAHGNVPTDSYLTGGWLQMLCGCRREEKLPKLQHLPPCFEVKVMSDFPKEWDPMKPRLKTGLSDSVQVSF